MIKAIKRLSVSNKVSTKDEEGGAAENKPTGAPDPDPATAKGPTKLQFGKSGKWNSAVTNVKRRQSIRRRSVTQEKDPFLDKFTVTGRAFEKNLDDYFHFTDLFTKKFWKELVFDPAEFPYYYWSFVVATAIMYNLIFIILRITFYDIIESDDRMFLWYKFDYLCDAIYLCDIFVQSRIGFLEQGLLVKDVPRLTNVYLKSWKFKADILSLIPTDLFYLLARNTAYRFNRLIKLWRMTEFFRLAETHTNYPNLFGVGKLIIYIIIIIHWNGCFYFAISRALGFGSDGWVYPDPSTHDFGDFFKMYVTSFYWSCLTLTTIGDTPYPESVASYCFCSVDSLIGVLIFATIFGNVGALINGMDANRTEYQAKVDAVKRYMELRGVFGELQVRVIKWFDYTWNNKQSFDDKQVLTYLPEKLRAEISIHVHIGTLRRVALFQDCEPGLLVELVLKLRLQVFSPGDYICRKGDIGKDMYIVKRGKLQVVSEDGKVIFVTLGDGAVFGEISVLNIAGNKTANRRTASVRSVGYSDLFCLSKNDLWDALQEYPEAKKNLMHKGQQILRKDNLLDEEMARREERRQQNIGMKIEFIADSIDDLQKDVKRLARIIDYQRKGSQMRMSSRLDIPDARSRSTVEVPKPPKENPFDPASKPEEKSEEKPKPAIKKTKSTEDKSEQTDGKTNSEDKSEQTDGKTKTGDKK